MIFYQATPLSNYIWEHIGKCCHHQNEKGKKKKAALFPSALEYNQVSGNCISSKGESYQLFNRWFSGLCWRWQVSDQVSFWGRFIPERIGQRNPIKMESVRSKISLDWTWGFRLTPSASVSPTCQITCRSHIFLTRHPDKPSILCPPFQPVYKLGLMPSRHPLKFKHHSTASCRSYALPMFIIMFKPDKFIGWQWGGNDMGWLRSYEICA